MTPPTGNVSQKPEKDVNSSRKDRKLEVAVVQNSLRSRTVLTIQVVVHLDFVSVGRSSMRILMGLVRPPDPTPNLVTPS